MKLSYSSSFLIENENIKFLSKSINCIKTIYKNYLNNDLIYMVNFPTIIVEFPHITYNTNDEIFYDFFKIYPQSYIIYMKINDSIDVLLKQMDNLSNFNTRAHFLFLIEYKSKNFLHSLKNYFISNVNFIILENDFEQTLYKIENFTYFPIGTCSNGILKMNSTYFQMNTSLILKQMELNVSYIIKPPYTLCAYCEKNQRGIELEIVNIITKHLNINVNYFELDEFAWGKKMNNNSYIGAYKFIRERKSDMLVGLFTIREDEQWDFDTVTTFLADYLHFAVPKAKQIRKWKIILYIFKWHVWFMYLISFLTIYIIWLLFVKYGKMESFTNYQIFSYLYQIVMETVPKFSSTTITIRILWIFWLFNVMILNTAFKTRLLNVIFGVIYEKQIDTWQEIVDHKYKIGLNYYTCSLFDKYDKIESYFAYPSIVCDNSWECTKRVAFKRDMVTVKFLGQLKYYGPKMFSDPNGKALLHITSKIVNIMYTNFVFVKGHPLASQFHIYIHRISQAGFLEYYLKESQRQNRISLQLAEIGKTGLILNALNFQQLLSVFILYGFGMFFSIVIFYFELIVAKVNKGINK